MATRYRLCCITKNKTNPAYLGARMGALRLAKTLGCALTNFAPDVPDDPVEQSALLGQALDSKPDAILIAPAHPTALNPALRKVEDAGIPLIFFVSRAEGIRAESFVTSNNRSLARAIGAYLIEGIGRPANLAIIEGSPVSPTSQPRTDGFLEAAAEHPDIEIVAQQSGNYQREDARQAMAAILAQQPGIDGVLCANDYMAMGVIDALESVNREAPVVGVNAMPDAIKAIKAGRLLATAAYDAMTMACAATHAAIRVLSNLPVPKIIELPVEIVDAQNCEIWDRPYEDRPLPSWESLIGGDR